MEVHKPSKSRWIVRCKRFDDRGVIAKTGGWGSILYIRQCDHRPRSERTFPVDESDIEALTEQFVG